MVSFFQLYQSRPSQRYMVGEDYFLAKVVVCDVQELEAVVNRFVPFASTDTAIIQSSTVTRRLPKL